MHAIILVGGRGTRLQPLTDTRPKPMLPLLDVPFLEHQLAHLRSHGVEAVTFACGFLPSAIQQHFGRGSRVDLELSYVVEPEPLDTAGAIAFAARTLEPQRLLVCNGDILTDLDIGRLLELHEARSASATIALTPVDDPSRYGLVRTAEDGAVLAFVEKPPPEECDTDLVNAGTYVLEPSVIERVPEGERCNIEREIFPQLVGDGLYALADRGYWNDIGTFGSYLAASIDLLHGRVGSRAAGGSDDADGVFVHPEATVESGAMLHGPLHIGPDARLASGAIVGPDVVVGTGSSIGSDTRIERSIVMEWAVIGNGAQLEGAIVAERAQVAPGCTLTAGAVVGPGVVEERLVVGAP